MTPAIACRSRGPDAEPVRRSAGPMIARGPMAWGAVAPGQMTSKSMRRSPLSCRRHFASRARTRRIPAGSLPRTGIVQEVDLGDTAGGISFAADHRHRAVEIAEQRLALPWQDGAGQGPRPIAPRFLEQTRQETAMRCEGKVVLVTGAQRGIGRAVALRFAQEGAHVALNSSTTSRRPRPPRPRSLRSVAVPARSGRTSEARGGAASRGGGRAQSGTH